MKEDIEFKIKFWGVRGSHPVAREDSLKFGGNTPCVELEIGDQLLILDAGTGLCNLGQKLCRENQKGIEGSLFLTHTHWDHIQGFPFFKPFYNEHNCFSIYGPYREGLCLQEVLSGQMSPPYFPVALEYLESQLHFYELRAGKLVELEGGIKIKTFDNHHPGQALSFRIEYQSLCCCYITDFEHSMELEEALIAFVSGADLIIYDATYTQSEYLKNRQGWGHSTWEEGVKLVQAAEGEKLILFHHELGRTDKELEEIEKKAQTLYKNTFVAREGMSIIL